MLKAMGLQLQFDELKVLDDISLTIPEGCFTALIGANGCGKTTLLNVLARMLRPASGDVLLQGKPHIQFSRRDLARQIALLPQRTASPAGITVRELVMQGRYPWQSWWQQWSDADQQAVDRAVALADVGMLLDRTLTSLSGGQLQRCWICLLYTSPSPRD